MVHVENQSDKMRLTRIIVYVMLCAWCISSSCDAAENVTNETPNVLVTIRKWVSNALNDPSGSLTRKILGADISPSCSVGLFKLMKSLRKVDPWILRLFDASGKYPTGLFQGTFSDMGAFDECLETVVLDRYGKEHVRGQYCTVSVKFPVQRDVIDEVAPIILMSHRRAKSFLINNNANKDIFGLQLGVCFLADCSQDDFQALLNSLVDGFAEVQVKGCVTSQRQPLTKRQVAIIASLGALVLVICASTVLDICLRRGLGKKRERGLILRFLTTFSVRANTKILTAVNRDQSSEAYAYRFLHGIRIISMFIIVLGHSYSAFDFINTSRLVNGLHFADQPSICIVMMGYLAVDAFFFISGFLMVYNIRKTKMNGFFLGPMAIVRRHIRSTVPAFFVIMCFYLVPVVLSGPGIPIIMGKFYYELRTKWWLLLLQIRNFGGEQQIGCFGHLWFICCDFQLFLVGLFVVLALKKWRVLTICVLVALSVAASSVNVWQIYGTEYTPFLLPITDTISVFLDTLNDVYGYPFYHGVCYFSGCITMLLIDKYGHSRIPKISQLVLWCLTITSGLACVFLKYDWNRGENPTAEWVKIPICYVDRFLWSACMMWAVFACATKRGGYLTRILSWEIFVPLSRLTYGIYIVHVPFFFIMFNVARERHFYGHFELVLQWFSVLVSSCIISFILFIACEAPVANLEKLVFGTIINRVTGTKKGNQNGKAIVVPNGHDNFECDAKTNGSLVKEISRL